MDDELEADMYDMMHDLSLRYKEMIEKNNPDYMEDEVWWFVIGYESGTRRHMDETIMYIWTGYIIGHLVARGYTDLETERHLVRKNLRLTRDNYQRKPPATWG